MIRKQGNLCVRVKRGCDKGCAASRSSGNQQDLNHWGRDSGWEYRLRRGTRRTVVAETAETLPCCEPTLPTRSTAFEPGWQSRHPGEDGAVRLPRELSSVASQRVAEKLFGF